MGKTDFNVTAIGDTVIVEDKRGVFYSRIKSRVESGTVKRLSLGVRDSDTYNPMSYLKCDTDVRNLAALITGTVDGHYCFDNARKEIYETGAYFLVSSIIAFLFHYRPRDEQNLSTVLDLIRAADVDENNSSTRSKLDLIFEDLRRRHPDCFAVREHDSFRGMCLADRMRAAAYAAYRLRDFSLPEVRDMTDTDSMCLGEPDTKIVFIEMVNRGTEPKIMRFLKSCMEYSLAQVGKMTA